MGKTPWRRKWQPTPVFLLGKLRGQRSLAGYSPWGHKESDTTEHTAPPRNWAGIWVFFPSPRPPPPAALLLVITLVGVRRAKERDRKGLYSGLDFLPRVMKAGKALLC